MHLHVEGSGEDLVTEFPLPEFLVFDHVGVAVAIGKVDVEVFYGFGDLLLDSSLLLLDLDDAAVGGPVTLYVLQRLLEEEGEVHALLAGHSEALEVDMTVVLRELLEEDNLQVVLIEGLYEALLVVVELSLDVLVEADAGLLVVDGGEDEVEKVLEGFEFGEGEVNVVGGAEEGQVLVVGAEHAIVLHSVRSHYRSVSFFYGFLYLFLAFVSLEVHAIVELPLLSLAGLG